MNLVAFRKLIVRKYFKSSLCEENFLFIGTSKNVLYFNTKLKFTFTKDSIFSHLEFYYF